MNEWLKQVGAKAKELWSKWKPIQKVILFVIIAIVIAVIFATARVSSKPSMVKLFPSPVTDENNLARILDRVNELNVDVEESEGYIYVADKKTKTRLIATLNDEGLVPSNIDIWADYFDRSWSTTDADQNVKLRVKKEQELKNFIEAYSDVISAQVTIELPPDKLFKDDQNPVKCGVIIKTAPNSTLLKERRRILGIHNSVLAAVEGLQSDYLIITDQATAEQVNDFTSMADSDAVDVTAKQQRLILKRENEIRAKILKQLQSIYTEDRCRDISVSVEMNMSKRESQSTEYSPIVRKEDNPDTPYDDSELVDYLPYSMQTVTKEYETVGVTPKGPPGTDGNNPPSYSDLDNLQGKWTETGVTANHVINTKNTQEITSPELGRRSVSGSRCRPVQACRISRQPFCGGIHRRRRGFRWRRRRSVSVRRCRLRCYAMDYCLQAGQDRCSPVRTTRESPPWS